MQTTLFDVAGRNWEDFFDDLANGPQAFCSHCKKGLWLDDMDVVLDTNSTEDVYCSSACFLTEQAADLDDNIEDHAGELTDLNTLAQDEWARNHHG